MTRLGVVPRAGAYAYVQSSTMGGYGSGLVQRVTRAGLGVVEASYILRSSWHESQSSKVGDNAGGERPKEGRVETDEPLKVKAKL